MAFAPYIVAVEISITCINIKSTEFL